MFSAREERGQRPKRLIKELTKAVGSQKPIWRFWFYSKRRNHQKYKTRRQLLSMEKIIIVMLLVGVVVFSGCANTNKEPEITSPQVFLSVNWEAEYIEKFSCKNEEVYFRDEKQDCTGVRNIGELGLPSKQNICSTNVEFTVNLNQDGQAECNTFTADGESILLSNSFVEVVNGKAGSTIPYPMRVDRNHAFNICCRIRKLGETWVDDKNLQVCASASLEGIC